MGVATFRKSESIQLHCIAKLAKSYSFLAFLEDGTSFALCDICDAGSVVLEGSEKMRSHRRLGCFRSLPRFERHDYVSSPWHNRCITDSLSNIHIRSPLLSSRSPCQSYVAHPFSHSPQSNNVAMIHALKLRSTASARGYLTKCAFVDSSRVLIVGTGTMGCSVKR